MGRLKIMSGALEKIAECKLPRELGFGKIIAPAFVECDYKDGKWGELKLIPYSPLHLGPEAKVFHYGQEIFEGLKGYYVDRKGPFLFRPDQNAKRFNLSAMRLGMPELPVNDFLESVTAMAYYCKEIIPTKSGESLYIRPCMIATEESLGIKPGLTYKYFVIASPSGPYFTGDSIKVYIERQRARACPGGIGAAKTGGNYAASLVSGKRAQELGCGQTLWLDAVHKTYIEEMSGMNFMSVIDGAIHTPAMTDTILDGITRKSIIQLAQEFGIRVLEEKMDINRLLELVAKGNCTEAFACGTAAIITPIRGFIEGDGSELAFKSAESKIAMKLRQELLDRQEGRKNAPPNWRVLVDNCN
ncbi:MAG: branched-chain amino acid aminotransferase [Bdellovibrio sp.]|nr:branched-chain amino acid aminotransferase [Bdellovibrio sp.]